MEASNHSVLAAKAREIYHKQLKQTLEASAHGKFVAIEVESGDYFLGANPLDAIRKGKQKYPKKVFHVMKVGYKAAILLKGRRL